MNWDRKLFPDRKFTLAIFFSLVSTLGLFASKLSGGEFVALVGTILGLYGIANVATKSVASHSPDHKRGDPNDKS